MAQRGPRLSSTNDEVGLRRESASDYDIGVADPSAVLDRLTVLQSEVDRLRQRELAQQAAIRRLDEELRSAGVVQRELLPRELPEARGLNVHIVYEPADVLSGDSYDAVRLSAAHVAFSVTDVTGHGASAALLSVFVKRSLRGFDDLPKASTQPIDPSDVLLRVHRDLLGLQLPNCQFVAGLYAVYDEQRRAIRIARGGLPPPILVRRGRPRLLASDGPLLGAVDEPRFETIELALEPGDALVFYTDGLDHALCDPTGATAAVDLESTDWYRSLGAGPLDEHLAALRRAPAALGPATHRVDDLTVLAMVVRDDRAPFA